MSTWFYDVPRPIYLVKHALARFDLRQNTYSYYTEKMVGPHNEDVSSSSSSDDQYEKSEELKTMGGGEEDHVGEGGKENTSATINNEAVKKTRTKCVADSPENQDDSVPSNEGHLPAVGQLGNQLDRMAVKDKLENDDEGGETNSANIEEDVRTAIKQRRGAPPDFQMIGKYKNKH